MNAQNRYSIRSRLFVGFGTIVAIILIAIGVTLAIEAKTERFASSVINTELPLFSSLQDLGGNIANYETASIAYILLKDPTYRTQITAINKNIDNLQRSINSLMVDANNKMLITQWETLQPLINQLRDFQQNGTDEKAAVAALTTLTNKIMTILDGEIAASGAREGGMYDLQYTILTNGSHVILNDMFIIRMTEYTLILVAIFSSLLIATLTSRSIAAHINLFRSYSSRVASRDLRQKLEVSTDDEIGMLGKDLNVMTQSLADITKQITSATQNMVTTLDEVKQAVNVQSSGATEQASSINEITASLEEIEKSSSQTMEKAKMLGLAAEKTREKGQLGLEAVEQSILGMKTVRDQVQLIAQTILDLSYQTQQVGEITAVVNTLAQQSKMLALNASIEAAKAGEAGKGFAVVAAEVKNLAEQSEQSTVQVQKILEDIRLASEKAVMVTEEGTKGVDHGTTLVEQTGQIVRNLSDVIHETTMATQQIEAAVRQESVGIEQITAGMNEINQVTASFVASSKQTTEAISNLTVIAKDLKENVDTYKV